MLWYKDPSVTLVVPVSHCLCNLFSELDRDWYLLLTLLKLRICISTQICQFVDNSKIQKHVLDFLSKVTPDSAVELTFLKRKTHTALPMPMFSTHSHHRYHVCKLSIFCAH